MYDKIEKYIDNVDLEHIPEDVKAIGFNLYEDGGGLWSMEIVGTGNAGRTGNTGRNTHTNFLG